MIGLAAGYHAGMLSSSRPAACRLRAQRGAITWVTALLVLLVASAGYLAWTYMPVYILHLNVKQVVHDFGNRAIKNADDAVLVAQLVQKLQSLESVKVEGPNGTERRRPVIDVNPGDVTWERLTDPPRLHVAFQYEREVELPLLDRTTSQALAIDMEMDISRVDWGR